MLQHNRVLELVAAQPSKDVGNIWIQAKRAREREREGEGDGGWQIFSDHDTTQKHQHLLQGPSTRS